MSKRSVFLFLLCFSYLLGDVCADPINFKEQYVTIRSRKGGMFCAVRTVMRFCNLYEQGDLGGIEVDFAQGGAYYDPEHGDNWWEYYFKPIQYGKGIRGLEYITPPDGAFSLTTAREKKTAHQIYKKYLRVNSDISAEVDEFVHQNFDGYYVIAVHYRGTDKVLSDAPRIEYSDMMERTQEVIKKSAKKKVRIFVATDEAPFITYMKEQFGDLVCYKEETKRATDGHALHKKSPTPYSSGREALIDCLLLSRGSYLIRTSSNLSLVSSYLNPKMPVLQLSERYIQTKRRNGK